MTVVAEPTEEVGVASLMEVIDRVELMAVAVTIDVVDRLKIEMTAHRGHDRTRCRVWSEERFDGLCATEHTLRSIIDSHTRFHRGQPAAQEAVT